MAEGGPGNEFFAQIAGLGRCGGDVPTPVSDMATTTPDRDGLRTRLGADDRVSKLQAGGEFGDR